MEYGLPFMPLSAKQQNGFAYKTMKDRLPVILTKIIDVTHRQKQNIMTMHGKDGLDDLKLIINQLSELKYHLITDKPILPFDSKIDDLLLYNTAIENLKNQEGGNPSWFKSPWLFVECYLYRKIAHIYDKSKFLREWDVFSFEKEQSYVNSIPAMTALALDLLAIKEKHPKLTDEKKIMSISNLVLISLWGNRCDLSISSGAQVAQDIICPMSQLKELQKYLLVDDTKKLVIEQLLNKQHKRIDFVLDNAGLELFSDLCLAELLVEIGSAKKVVFHVKRIPWYFSDTTSSDFSWTLEMLQSSNAPSLKDLGRKLQSRIDSGVFQVETHYFWTLHCAYSQMKHIAPDLYTHLSQSGLLIFKGDLNYRKLTCDLAWPCNTPFAQALLGFNPTSLVSLRTLKADTVVGVDEAVVDIIRDTTKTTYQWMVDGKYAVIQYQPKSA